MFFPSRVKHIQVAGAQRERASQLCQIFLFFASVFVQVLSVHGLSKVFIFFLFFSFVFLQVLSVHVLFNLFI